MVWNVYYHDINSDRIKTFNIFDHGRFREDVVAAFKKYKTKEEFADRVRSDLFYYFWAKAEWEIYISQWVGGKDENGRKVDVYQQVTLNWDAFIDYLWERMNEK